jgi:hypothetical protein
MKRCPRCNRIYSEDGLNFCLDDGELLQGYSDEQPTRPLGRPEPPPTIFLDEPRVTNPIGWQAGQNIQPWQTAQPQTTPVYTQPAYYRGSLDQTLPTISLVLGTLSIVTSCCFGGVYLGIPAIVVGFLGMRNADSNPAKYGGKGLAIAGMVIGIVTLLIAILHFFGAILSKS